MESKLKKAAFAAGCFWGVEKIFSQMDGVVSTTVGYMGGTAKDPTYEQVCAGRTGHAETLELLYDPSRISYRDLLITFWQYHDPTTLNRQGPDVGSQYRSIVFFYDKEQAAAAERAKQILDQSKIFQAPIVTEIVPASTFYRAEEYHQKYLEKNPGGYCSHHLHSTKIGEVLRARQP
ncbi:MAG: peptide-methionine (S)-S-oxide reductase MsrA [Candidatus Omnitrophica bacterium]|nr:peptide-methionine (S)-S-oxide reductase MsrA [Candidatus Omnitrophota bacterium]